MDQFPTAYDPAEIEEKWYQRWEQAGLFEGGKQEGRPPYCITIPPPNVTGSLHMGHALNHTIHDIVARYKRMKGYDVLVVPGTDHAGIATQVVVEKELAREGLSRHQLGREKFLERVWKWKEEYGGIILHQMRRLGCSYDWGRERFTMDPGYERAVLETFLRLWEEGLIYRGYRIVNWCPRCLTALSDLEVEREEEGEPGFLWFVRYPLLEPVGDERFITVATTRPETMLGDVAVAVHPEDSRYRHLLGKTAVLPLVGRYLPIIGDEAVDPRFGTGAVKVTPAHDPADFEIAQRKNLPKPLVMDETGTMINVPDRFAGLDRFIARQEVVKALEEEGLLERTEDYRVPLGRCYRCDTVIEPLMSLQWFVRMEPLAQIALTVLSENKIEYLPPRFLRLTIDWLTNVKDWCISRQIWWGHRIPVWYCLDCNAGRWQRKRYGDEDRYHFSEDARPFAALTTPLSCPDCQGTHLGQDPDVLDTWFSSAIWPHAVLGWPQETKELSRFYPTDLMITDRGILYLWVARMIITGVKFAGDIPFRTVYVHPTVLTREGRRMSKSLGTGIDPMDLLGRYGADGLRLGLIVQAEGTQDLRFHEERLEMARNFGKKLWNASRFVATALQSGPCATWEEALARNPTLPEAWIRSRWQRTVLAVGQLLDQNDLASAGMTLYNFLWDDFCDWFVEISKPALSDSTIGPFYRATLRTILDSCLRLLHPFMPFVTEELWHRLHFPSQQEPFLMIARYPTFERDHIDEEAEKKMAFLMELVRRTRALKADLGIPTAIIPLVFAGDEPQRRVLEENLWWLRFIGRWQEVRWVAFGQPVPGALSESVDGAEVYLPLSGLGNLSKIRERLSRQLSDVQKESARTRSRLSNPQFLEKAPQQVVQSLKERLAELESSQKVLQARLSALEKFSSEPNPSPS
ncbi:MAG: valine--tRNA ligase [Armatimonadetes bacterium]|nr:valine--tRNA ligase [Armatimonadota bacterium]MDW8120808.1 valine--tRNA ligase [Armatimonadota bacterium]